MINKRSLNKSIKMDPYGWHVYVVIGQEELEYIKKRYKCDLAVNADERALHFSCKDSAGCAFSVLYFGVDTVTDFGIIAHECVHAVHEMFKDRGVPCGYKNSEGVAYHLQELVNEVIGIIMKRGYYEDLIEVKDKKKGA